MYVVNLNINSDSLKHQWILSKAIGSMVLKRKHKEWEVKKVGSPTQTKRLSFAFEETDLIISKGHQEPIRCTAARSLQSHAVLLFNALFELEIINYPPPRQYKYDSNKSGHSCYLVDFICGYSFLNWTSKVIVKSQEDTPTQLASSFFFFCLLM